MDKRILEAYASLNSGYIGNTQELLDEILCENLNLPKGSLNNLYAEIAAEANQEAQGNHDIFINHILKSYLDIERRVRI